MILVSQAKQPITKETPKIISLAGYDKPVTKASFRSPGKIMAHKHAGIRDSSSRRMNMYYLRKIFLTTLLVNILVLFAWHAVPAAGNAITQAPVDDWQYRWMPDADEEAEPDFGEKSADILFYTLSAWMTLEFFRLMFALGMGFGTIVSITVICVLASVSGPMISSITDQGRASIRDYGYSTGGAKDINNFRQNIAAGYLPQPSDITYEGLFYDYRFDTGSASADQSGSGKLFVPAWSSAVSKNPLTGEVEQYLAVGLKSGRSLEEFSRKKLNLVVVLDISGSMSSSFYEYYYGGHRRRNDFDEQTAKMSKLQSACQSICAMLDHLRPDDRFGMILFNHEAHLAKPISIVGATDIKALKGHILSLMPTGATNMEEGLEEGSRMLMPFTLSNPDEFENRIIFLTDAMPNTDDTSESGLQAIAENMAKHRIHTTFVGMGVDFNSQLIKSISKVRGANYYSVHSPVEFKKRLADEFEFMVTPVIFDLALTLKAPGFRISQVIGSPEADMATGRIMHVKTLFPAPTDENGTRGGIILLRLEKLNDNPEITLTVNYEDRSGNEDEVNSIFAFTAKEPEHFDDAGIRKGVLLARYADLIKNSSTASHKRVGPANEGKTDGSGWSYWERPARALTVPLAAKSDIDRFCEHLKIEMTNIGDRNLEKEVQVLSQLSNLVEQTVVAQ